MPRAALALASPDGTKVAFVKEVDDHVVVIVGIVAPLRLVGSQDARPPGIYARDLAARARRATAVAAAPRAE